MAPQASPQPRYTKLEAQPERRAPQDTQARVPLESRSWPEALAWRRLMQQQAMPPVQLASELTELEVVA